MLVLEVVIDPSPEVKERFREDSGENLAELPLIARGADSEDLAFKIILGHPFQRSRFPGNYAVRIELDGLEAACSPIMGGDQFQAIVLAIRFMLSRLSDITQKRRLELFWAEDPSVRFDPYEYFNTIPVNSQQEQQQQQNQQGNEESVSPADSQ